MISEARLPHRMPNHHNKRQQRDAHQHTPLRKAPQAVTAFGTSRAVPHSGHTPRSPTAYRHRPHTPRPTAAHEQSPQTKQNEPPRRPPHRAHHREVTDHPDPDNACRQRSIEPRQRTEFVRKTEPLAAHGKVITDGRRIPLIPLRHRNEGPAVPERPTRPRSGLHPIRLALRGVVRHASIRVDLLVLKRPPPSKHRAPELSHGLREVQLSRVSTMRSQHGVADEPAGINIRPPPTRHRQRMPHHNNKRQHRQPNHQSPPAQSPHHPTLPAPSRFPNPLPSPSAPSATSVTPRTPPAQRIKNARLRRGGRREES